MSIEPGQPSSRAVGWADDWQRLGWTAINQAMGHYLRGCANVGMARTPQQALAALHTTQTSLLRHSADTFAQVARLLAQARHRTVVHPSRTRPHTLATSREVHERLATIEEL